MIGFLKEVPKAPAMSAASEIDRTYHYWRIHIMFTMYVGYAVFYFTRKSFNFVVPELIVDLGFEKSDIGLIGTLFYITYGTSKFLSGMVSDHSNPRYFMGVGLIITGIINILFGMSSALWLFVTLWMVNAFFQGWGMAAVFQAANHMVFKGRERHLVGDMEHVTQRRRRFNSYPSRNRHCLFRLASRNGYPWANRDSCRCILVLATPRSTTIDWPSVRR